MARGVELLAYSMGYIQLLRSCGECALSIPALHAGLSMVIHLRRIWSGVFIPIYTCLTTPYLRFHAGLSMVIHLRRIWSGVFYLCVHALGIFDMAFTISAVALKANNRLPRVCL